MSDPEYPSQFGWRLSPGRVRNLSVEELGLEPPKKASAPSAPGGPGGRVPIGAAAAGADDEPEPLPENDPLLRMVRRLLEQWGGVILVGPPGTSKTYFARRIALSLAGSSARVRYVQFHASYQYEDFVQGYVPEEGGFRLAEKHLLKLCDEAGRDSRVTYVIVIDELSRGDAARIFGEALTYVEKTHRGERFSLASGDDCVIPHNLVFLATMNPMDRGVDEVDAAFERRFGKIALDPDREILRGFLNDAGTDSASRRGRARAVLTRRELHRQRRMRPRRTPDRALCCGGPTTRLGLSATRISWAQGTRPTCAGSGTISSASSSTRHTGSTRTRTGMCWTHGRRSSRRQSAHRGALAQAVSRSGAQDPLALRVRPPRA